MNLITMFESFTLCFYLNLLSIGFENAKAFNFVSLAITLNKIHKDSIGSSLSTNISINQDHHINEYMKFLNIFLIMIYY